MGLIKRAFSPIRNVTSFAPIAIPSYISGRAAFPDNRYETYAREGYAKNELVYAAIEELATSAAEPRLRAKIGQEWRLEHPIITLLNRPNPFMDRFEFFATIILHLSLAGNAYALIVRSASGKALELWLMAPFRVAVVPSSTSYIARYEYLTGYSDPVPLPVGDVIHFKKRNPFESPYGMPPLMAAAGRVDIDNFMRDFVKVYFEKAGVPGGLLNIEGAADPDFKRELKDRWSGEFGGPSGWHGLMVIDQKKASFTPMTANLGASGLVVPELDKISVRRILMPFGVPGALVGADDAPTSYAALEMVQRFFWDNTLAPLYKELAGSLNLKLVPNFPGVTEIEFDLSDVRALRDDVDKVHTRLRSDLTSGGITIEEFRIGTGRKAAPDTEGTYLLPMNLVPVASSEVQSGNVREVVKGNPQGDATIEPAIQASKDAPGGGNGAAG